ncbi:hypothetical protein [Uliginosibacterium sp. H1]|uniref:hypothetical protein n=1 Tax=Uliginosibacterium sp. H1 TaxID=3114757 RepID=UPI002E197E13|nr:hypothetical protein [Uliginosibacterium sp. H1]
MMKRAFCLCVVACLLGGTSAFAAGPSLSPAQVAYLKAETRKADEGFIRDVAMSLNIPAMTVRRAMPSQGRITDPVARLIAGLENDLRRPLNDDQKQRIRDADQRYRQALADAQKAARSK